MTLRYIHAENSLHLLRLEYNIIIIIRRRRKKKTYYMI